MVPAESVAVKTLQRLKKADTEKMLILFKSIHAIVKAIVHCQTLSGYVNWMSQIENVNIINDIYDNKDIDDDFCDDFQSKADNFMGIKMYSRE